MKDFDSERRRWAAEDRTFKLGGETFVARETVMPETLALYEDRLDSEGGQSLRNLIETTDVVLLLMIEGGDDLSETGAGGRYQRVRANDDDPVDLDTLAKVVEWIFEVHANRPTSPPGDSLSGPGGTGTTSTGISSTPALAAQIA